MLKEKILRLFPAFTLAFVVAAGGVSSQALAETTYLTLVHVFYDDEDGDGIGDTEVYADEDGNIYYQFYDEAGNETGFTGSSNPKPEGGSTGLVDPKGAIEELMKNGGAKIVYENDFLETTLGMTLIKHSYTGSIIPVHNPAEMRPGENGGGGGGAGGYDPMGGSIVDQLKKGKKKGNGKDDGGSDGGQKTHIADQFPGLWELVNPVPIDLPRAKPGNTKVQHIPAPAITKKDKGLIGKKANYPDVPNLPSPTAATEQPSAAVANIRNMRGRIKIASRPMSMRTIRPR